MNYVDWQLNVHSNVMEALDSDTLPVAVRRKLSMDLRRLMLDGRTGKVKATHGAANCDWLRSPLGGNNGNHYYLWWRRAGMGSDGRRHILARAVRHHDDHQPLTVDESAFHALRPGDLMGHPDRDAGMQTPWNDEQLTFFRSEARVQILQGSPGTGKTSLIQESIQQLRGRVLYLTQSRPLLEDAAHYLQLFAPGANVRLMTLREWMGELLGVEAPPFSQFVDFRDATDRIPSQRLGVWSDDRYGLWCEYYGHIAGRYASWLRDGKWGAEEQRQWEAERAAELGESAKEGVRAAMATLSQSHEDLQRLFPELYAAARLEGQITRERVAAMGQFDLIVVDEVQDLTQVDLANVTAFASLTLRETQNSAQQLIVAGDEAQTIRPTDFRFGTAKRIVGERFASNQHTELTTNMRCPPRVAKLVNRAWDLYGSLDRRERPRGDAHVRVDENVEDTVHLVLVPNQAQMNQLISDLARREYTVVSTAPVAATDGQGNPDVRRVDDVKGRDLALVALVGTQLLLQSLHRGENPDKWQVHQQRQSIDRLRVALSRATEQLVFLEVAENETEVELLMQLLAPVDPHVCTPEAFMATLGAVDIATYIEGFLQDVRQKAESNPTTAWYSLQHAVRTYAEQERAGIKLADVATQIHDAHTQYAAEFATVYRKSWRHESLNTDQLLCRAAELEEAAGKRPHFAAWLRAAGAARESGVSEWAATWTAMEQARQMALPMSGWRERVEQALRTEFRNEWLPKLLSEVRASDTQAVLDMLEDGGLAKWLFAADTNRYDATLLEWGNRCESRKAWSDALRVYRRMRNPPAEKQGLCAEQAGQWDAALGHYERVHDVDGQVRMLRALGRSVDARELLRDRSASVARASRDVLDFFDRVQELLRDTPRGIVWQARHSGSVHESARQWSAIRPLFKAAFQKEPSFDVPDSMMALYFWAGFSKPPGMQQFPTWLGAEFNAFLADAFAYPFEKTRRRTVELSAVLKTILDDHARRPTTESDIPKLPRLACRAALVYSLAQFSINSAAEDRTSNESTEFWKLASRVARLLNLPFPGTRLPEPVDALVDADEVPPYNDGELLQHVLLYGSEWMDESNLLLNPNSRFLQRLAAWPVLAQRSLQAGDYARAGVYLQQYADVAKWAATLKAFCDRSDVQNATNRLYDAERETLRRMLEPLMAALSGRHFLEPRRSLASDWTEFKAWQASAPVRGSVSGEALNMAGTVDITDAEREQLIKAGGKVARDKGDSKRAPLPRGKRHRR